MASAPMAMAPIANAPMAAAPRHRRPIGIVERSSAFRGKIGIHAGTAFQK